MSLFLFICCFFLLFLHLNITAINCLSIIAASKKTARQTAGGRTKKAKGEEPRKREHAGEPGEREKEGADEPRARNEIGKRGEK